MRKTVASAFAALCLTGLSIPALATFGLRIEQVAISADGNRTELVITGVNFDNGRDPKVFLNGIPLQVTSAGPNVITAWTPADLVPGSYEIAVRTGLAAARRDTFEGVTIVEPPATRVSAAP